MKIVPQRSVLPRHLPEVVYKPWQAHTARDFRGRYEAVHRALTDPQWIRKRFGLLWGTAHVNPTPLLGATHRSKIDDQILQNIVSRLAQKQVPRILEGGAGYSWQTDLNSNKLPTYLGAPWFSRALQLAFGNLIDLSVSDLEPQDPPESRDYVVIMRQKSRTLVFRAMKSSGNFFDSSITLDSIEGWNRPERDLIGAYENVPLSELPQGGMTEALSLVDQNSEAYQRIRRTLTTNRQKAALAQEGEIMIRPRWDPAMEHLVFGLQAYGDVDLLNLYESAPGDDFYDVIFGRCLSPGMPSEQLVISCQRTLSLGGSYFIQIHDKNFTGIKS